MSKNSIHIVKLMVAFVLTTMMRAEVFAEAPAPASFLVHEETIQKLEAVLADASIAKSPYKREYLQRLFQARVAAHRLRLSQVFLELAKDPSFSKNFPEFSPLMNNTNKTLEILLKHDASKSAESTRLAAKALALLQGYDFKNANKSLSPQMNSFVNQVGLDAVHDINMSDDKIISGALKSIGPNAEWSRLHKNLTEVIDFYDTYKSRQSELAKGGRNLVKPSEWMKKLMSEGHYSAQEMAEMPAKLRFAEFIEKSDPLKNSRGFASSTDFLKLGETEGAKAAEVGFVQGSKELMKKAGAIQAGRAFKNLAMKAGGLPVKVAVGLGLLVTTGTIDAETAFDILVPFQFKSTETSNCDSVNCDRFMKDCAKLLKLPVAATTREVVGAEHFQLCAEKFFRQDLEKQTELREDANLDRVLAQFSPNIRTLNCSKDSAKIEINRPGKQNYFMNFIYGPKGQLSIIKREGNGDFEREQILANDWSHSQFEHCDQNKTCRRYPVKEFALKNLYFSLDKTPIESFAWAQKSSDVVNFEGDRIYRCCQKSACENFFTERVTKFNAAKAALASSSFAR
jgi:hypothetical protein